MITLTVTKENQECAIRILDRCGGNWQSIAKEVAKHRQDFTEDLKVQLAQAAEREAQAVQREHEAAKGLVKELRESIVDLLGFAEKYTPESILPSAFPRWARENVAKADAYCSTYNDNRKG